MAEREKSVSIEQLIVDTGSEFTWLPENVLSGIGVKVEKRDQKFVMANGEVITRDIGYAILKANGFETVDEIVFARRGDLSLLGSRTLEGFGAVVDASRKQLVAAGPHLAAVAQVDNLRIGTIGKNASQQLAPQYEAIH